MGTGGARPPFGRKVKRVSDVNAMGYNQAPAYPFPNGAGLDQPQPTFSQPPQPDYMNQGSYNQPNQANHQQPMPGQQIPPGNYDPNAFMNPNAIFQQPIVQNMAMQYTQQMASTGATMMKKEMEKYVPISRLQYYFAVDTKYALTKLGLLFFPFTHSDWSIKFEQDTPVQPRYEINAPDLYIPTMAYVTYVVVAGLVLGMQNRFSPEQFGIQSSSALAWCLLELAVYSCTLYIGNIQTSLRTLDLLAYSGYKFVGIIVSTLMSIVGGTAAYYATLGYCSLALAFYLMRVLRSQVLPVTTHQTSYYGETDSGYGNKRRLYFLLFVAGAQPVLSWWLSFHLIRYTAPAPVLP